MNRVDCKNLFIMRGCRFCPFNGLISLSASSAFNSCSDLGDRDESCWLADEIRLGPGVGIRSCIRRIAAIDDEESVNSLVPFSFTASAASDSVVGKLLGRSLCLGLSLALFLFSFLFFARDLILGQPLCAGFVDLSHFSATDSVVGKPAFGRSSVSFSGRFVIVSSALSFPASAEVDVSG